MLVYIIDSLRIYQVHLLIYLLIVYSFKILFIGLKNDFLFTNSLFLNQLKKHIRKSMKTRQEIVKIKYLDRFNILLFLKLHLQFANAFLNINMFKCIREKSYID